MENTNTQSSSAAAKAAKTASQASALDQVKGHLIDERIIPPAPSSAVFRQYMAQQPSLATGAVAVDIPIYTIDFKGFRLPIALKYLSNGVRVFDSPYPCGYGWSLHPGLRISRTVVGRPDERFPRAGVWEDSANPNREWGTEYDFARRCLHDGPVPFDGYNLDAGHDIYTIHLADKSYVRIAEFTDDAVEFKGADNELKIEATRGLDSISVTDPNGVKYVFSGVREGVEAYGVVTTWMATKIVLPFGQEISLKWGQKENRALRRQVIGQAVWSDDIATVSGQIYTHDTPGDQGEEPYVYVDPHASIFVLEKIEWAEGAVTISYDSVANPVIKHISVDSAEGNVLKADFGYESTELLGSLLTSVYLSSEGKYEFSYNPRRFASDTAQDWWGYYNGADSNRWLLPRVKMLTAEYTWQEHKYKWLTEFDVNREPDAEAMKACILEKVTYPTGGWTEFEYEPHKFAPKIQWHYYEIDENYNHTLSIGGGLRLKSSTTCAGDDSPAITKTYVYGKDGDGLAVCERVPSPITFVKQRWTQGVPFTPQGGPDGQYTYTYRQTIISAFSWYNDFNFGGTPIWYAEVSEQCGDVKKVNRLAQIAAPNEYSLQGYACAPVYLGKAASQGPVVVASEKYANVKGEWKLQEKEGYVYKEFKRASDVRDTYVRQVTVNSFTKDAPSYPLGFNNQGIDKTQPVVMDTLFLAVDESEVYTFNTYTLSLGEERLVEKSVTTYRDNGSATLRTSYEYVEGTGLIEKVTVTDGTETRVSTVTYPSADTAVGQGMIDKHMIGATVATREERDGMSIETRYDYAAVGSAFAPEKAYLRRGGEEIEVARLSYNSDGNPVSVNVLGEPGYSLLWDAAGLHPTRKIQYSVVKQLFDPDRVVLRSAPSLTLAGSLEWGFEFKPLVGLASTTDPAGVTSRYAYDSRSRLVEASVDGHGPVKRWEYGTVSDGDSANFVRETKMLSATGGVAACAFYDGLGRQWQSASEGAAPGGGAVCAITEYDSMGRKVAEWMPADASGSAFGSADEFKAASASLYGDSCARTDYGYGLTQGAEPDTVTRPGSLLRESGASIVTERLVNEEEGLLSCMDLRVSATGRLVKKGVHAPGRLAVTVTTDEDGRQALAFANLFGEKVMERRVMGDGEYADTYFVSDGHGDLRYMVPPMLADTVASAADGTEWDASDTEFDRYAYYYEYNRAGKPTVKKLPGREAVEYVYDEGMRPVLWRDGNLRAAGKWAYRILDAHMRPALEGEAEMEDGVAAAFGGCSPTAKADSSKPLGYAVVGLPKGADLGEADLATYYDDYSFIGDAEGFGSAPSSAHGSAKGRMTGRRVNGRLEACYYDLAGNLVATCAENRFGHVDTTSTDYSYSGQPLRVTTTVKGPDGKTVRHIGSTEYDSVGRPVRTKSRLMSDLRTVETSAMSYGACGRLSSATLGSTEVGYGYDCQGRLAEIASAPFSLGVGYEDGLCMGGDVTSVTWNYGGESRTMAYAYDRLDRLVSASLNGLPLSDYSYDKHSSPLSVVRQGVDPSAAAERLSYGYDGNLLVSLSDSRGSHTLGWDANGNLSSDSSRGIESISYDRNNLPKRVDLAGGEWIEFGYDALGRKHSQVRRDDDFGSIVVPPIGLNAEVAQPLAGGVIEIDPIKPVDPIGPFRPFGEKSRVDYAGNCVYEDRALKMVLIPEGYIKADGIVGEYRYYVRDHQGNVRAVVDGEGNLVEANDYYPYGLPLPAAGGLAGNAQPYKYGGKELLSACHGGDSGADALTGLYDFGPRWQSSPTALWAQPDPEAESYPGISPYAYCAANPARYVDPTGCKIDFNKNVPDWIKEALKNISANNELVNEVYSILYSSETKFKIECGDTRLPNGEPCNGYFDPETDTIAFSTNLTENGSDFLDTASEEMYHAFQKMDGALGGSENIEYEAHAFALIVTMENGYGYCLTNEGLEDLSKSINKNYLNEDGLKFVYKETFVEDYVSAGKKFVAGEKGNGNTISAYIQPVSKMPARLSGLLKRFRSK